MSKILELREKRNKTWEAAKAFLDSKRGSNGLISPEDAEVYDRMEEDVINLGNEIKRLERQEALEAQLNLPINTRIVEEPSKHEKESKTGIASNEYKRSFWKVMKSKTPSIEIVNSLSVGTDSEGGFLVPDEFERTLVQTLEEENIFRKLAKIVKTSSGDRKIPVVTTKGSAAWLDEGEEFEESDSVFGQTSIGAYKLGTMIKISDELLNDSAFNMESYISTEFARRIGAKEEEAFLIGDGVGKPTGIFNDTGGAEIGVTTTSATAITADEIIDLVFSLKAPYRKNAVFIMNDATIKAIRKLKDGQGQYLWQPSLTAGTPDTLLNRPVFTSAYAPTLESGAKSIAFGDFGYYWIADRQGRSFKRLNELFATTGQVGFLASQRVDGKLILPEAIKVLQQK